MPPLLFLFRELLLWYGEASGNQHVSLLLVDLRGGGDQREPVLHVYANHHELSRADVLWDVLGEGQGYLGC